MSLALSPGIVTNGLIFNYDMYNKKSFSGAPTTNLVSSAAAFGSWNNYWRTDYINTFTTEFGTTGYRITGNPSWNGLYRGITLPSTGTYTFSAWFRYWGGTSSNNGAQVYVSGWGGGDSATGLDKSLIGVWQRASITLNCTSTSPTFYIISYGGDSSGRADCSTWDVTMPQVESGSYATGFVDGARSSTQAVLDLTNSSTVITANPTYNSDGTISFNGSGQYLNASRSDINGGSWAYSNVTACAWVWIDPTSSSGENNIATVENAWEYRWNNNNNGTAAVYYASNPWAWYGSGTVNTGVWQMITFRHGSSTGDIWSNATQVFTQAISGTLSAGTGSYPMLTLMGRTGGPGSSAKGKLGAFQLYGRALSDPEIIQNYNALRGRYGV